MSQSVQQCRKYC